MTRNHRAVLRAQHRRALLRKWHGSPRAETHTITSPAETPVPQPSSPALSALSARSADIRDDQKDNHTASVSATVTSPMSDPQIDDIPSATPSATETSDIEQSTEPSSTQDDNQTPTPTPTPTPDEQPSYTQPSAMPTPSAVPEGPEDTSSAPEPTKPPPPSTPVPTEQDTTTPADSDSAVTRTHAPSSKTTFFEAWTEPEDDGSPSLSHGQASAVPPSDTPTVSNPNPTISSEKPYQTHTPYVELNALVLTHSATSNPWNVLPMTLSGSLSHRPRHRHRLGRRRVPGYRRRPHPHGRNRHLRLLPKFSSPQQRLLLLPLGVTGVAVAQTRPNNLEMPAKHSSRRRRLWSLPWPWRRPP